MPRYPLSVWVEHTPKHYTGKPNTGQMDSNPLGLAMMFSVGQRTDLQVGRLVSSMLPYRQHNQGYALRQKSQAVLDF